MGWAVRDQYICNLFAALWSSWDRKMPSCQIVSAANGDAPVIDGTGDEGGDVVLHGLLEGRPHVVPFLRRLQHLNLHLHHPAHHTIFSQEMISTFLDCVK